jgi:hypothetical protein
MGTIFKSLARGDYTVKPFPTYYDYVYTFTSGSEFNLSPAASVNSPDVQILYGSKYPFEDISLRAPNAEYDLYDSIMHTFYSPYSVSLYGIQSTSYAPQDNMYVVSITQDLYGEKIVPTTFKLTVDSTSSYDDGIGNLIASSSGVGQNIGFVFYDKGIAVIKPKVDTTTSMGNDGLYLAEGGTAEIQFRSTVTVYETLIRVKLEPSDFLHSPNNPTSKAIVSQSKRAIDLMYNKTVLQSPTGSTVLFPYITTIGLYNENSELLAVAKVSNPIQRTDGIPQTFIIKFDT